MDYVGSSWTIDWAVVAGIVSAVLVVWARRFVPMLPTIKNWKRNYKNYINNYSLMDHQVHLENLGELGLIASILLCHFFVLLSIEAEHLRTELPTNCADILYKCSFNYVFYSSCSLYNIYTNSRIQDHYRLKRKYDKNTIRFGVEE